MCQLTKNKNEPNRLITNYLALRNNNYVMNSAKNIAVAILILLALTLNAQNRTEDVMYLKNGNVYRGSIIEQVPGQTMKIQTEGGNIYNVAVVDIEKITKEQPWQSTDNNPYRGGTNQDYHYEGHRDMKHKGIDSGRVYHYQKRRTYFFWSELRGGPGNGGVHIINGYKFGRFGYVGVGVGIDGASFGASMGPMFNGRPYNNYSDGVYLPLFVRYSGDILRKRFTPFYYADLGYGFRPMGPFFENEMRSYGGPTAAIGFGCKFNTKRRINFKLDLNVNYRGNMYRGYSYYYDYVSGNNIQTYERGYDSRIFGSFGFGIGF